MTKEEFEKQYAENSGVTVERLHELGRYAVPCDCGDKSCQGWQMAHRDTTTNIDEMQAGRELDVIVAAKIMGWVLSDRGFYYRAGYPESHNSLQNWKPSTDIAAAFEVQKEIERLELQDKFVAYLMASNPNNAYLIADEWWLVNAPPDARCRSALKAVSE